MRRAYHAWNSCGRADGGGHLVDTPAGEIYVEDRLTSYLK